MPPVDLNRAKARVLVVDDSPETQRYFRRLLELDRYCVETAGNGVEALRRVRDGFAPELVLLDMQMPEMDGLETLRHLRALQPDLRVIICSGEENPDTIRQVLSLGAQAYLVKPVPHLYLSAAVAGCLALESAKPLSAYSSPYVLAWPAGPCRPN
jgi:CheY-like chemotaxis protein